MTDRTRPPAASTSSSAPQAGGQQADQGIDNQELQVRPTRAQGTEEGDASAQPTLQRSGGSPRPDARSRRRTRLLAGIGVLVLLAAGAGWWLRDDGELPAPTGATAAAPIVEIAPDQRQAPVDLVGTDLEGQPLALADFRGAVTVVNIWGSWCAPCRAEAPVLAALSTQYADRGVRFVGIDVQDRPSAAQAFERRYGITYPSFDDQESRGLLTFRDSVPPRAIPSTLVLDTSGRVAATNVGQVSEATLRALLEGVLAQTPSPTPSPTSTASAGAP